MKKLRVGVLMGGKSLEHEVSFNSGRTVCDHLDTACYSIVPIYMTSNGELYILPWHFLHRGKTTDFVNRLESEAQKIVFDDLKELIDFVYLAIHGRFAEDGTIQGFLEVLGIPYLGSDVYASALSMDKIIQKKILEHNGFKVAPGLALYPQQISKMQDDPDYIFQLIQETGLHLPFVVKPSGQGSSIGVRVVKSEAELCSAIISAAQVDGAKFQSILVEEKLTGMEFSCIVLQDADKDVFMPLPPTEIAQDDGYSIFDYEQKYMPGKATEYTPARCLQEDIIKIQQAAVDVTKLLCVTTISRVDGFLLQDGSIAIFEVNTLSGMGPASLLFRAAAEAGLSHTALINHLIETELKLYSIKTHDIDSLPSDKHMPINDKKRFRVAVLLGGTTHEKEISLESGRNVVYKLSPEKYEAIPLFVSSSMELYRLNQSLLVRNSTAEIEGCVEESQKVRWADLPQLCDFVFIALHGGLGENGSVQGTLEMLGLPYNGSSVLASAMCMDKYKANEYLKNFGIDVPKSVFIAKNDWYLDKEKFVAEIITSLGLPVIVKPHDDGCSVMVQKIKHKHDLIPAVEAIFDDGKTYAFIEECIIGTELTVGVIGNDDPIALPPSQVVTAGDILSLEEKFLPGAGENQTPALIPSSAIKFVQSTMEKVFKVIGCKGYVRIDCFYQNESQSPTNRERVIILEVNSLPALTPATCIFHQAAEIGIKPMDFIDLIITLGLQQHSLRNESTEVSSCMSLKTMIEQLATEKLEH